MSDERLDCPEPFCVVAMRREELIAHLQMDHGYRSRSARLRVGQEYGGESADE